MRRQLAVDTLAYQIGNTPDVIASFSSRGPGAGNVLKPDIAAPGVNILAQGYAVGVTGEARHLGYGQASGTSMAAPHIAGAAALLKQAHPDWSPAWIKSALMSTSKYIGITTHTGAPAQPLDMGAGRLDLTNAADPGVILIPPSLSFGSVPMGQEGMAEFIVTSVATATQTYSVSTFYTGDGFDALTNVAGMTVDPASVTLAPGESTSVVVLWDTEAATGFGDNQGFVVLESADYEAHLPAWMRVAYPAQAADVLVIDNDGSSSLDLPDYTSYYTRTLEGLGYSYEVWDADDYAGNAETMPDANFLAQYDTIIYQTGDNYQPDGTFTVPTPPTQIDMNHLVEYANNGGAIIAFGQDLSSLTGGSSSTQSSRPLFYYFTLGGVYLQDSVSGEVVHPNQPQLITGAPESPFANFTLDISASGDGAGNQAFVDELDRTEHVTDICDPSHPADCQDQFRPLLKYSEGDKLVEDGLVATSHREQPTLERPGVTFAGRTIYFTFGLEGVNSDTGFNTRADLLGAALAWVRDSNKVVIHVGSDHVGEHDSIGVSYRWDFGDDSPFTNATTSATGGQAYEAAGVYTVRVEATNALGFASAGVGGRRRRQRTWSAR